MANARIVNTPSQAIAQYGTVHHQNTISSSAENVVDWTMSTDTTHLLVQCTGADARVTFDATTSPTSTKGFRFPANSSAYWTKRMALNAKAIREAGTDCVFEMQELNYL